MILLSFREYLFKFNPIQKRHVFTVFFIFLYFVSGFGVVHASHPKASLSEIKTALNVADHTQKNIRTYLLKGTYTEDVQELAFDVFIDMGLFKIAFDLSEGDLIQFVQDQGLGVYFADCGYAQSIGASCLPSEVKNIEMTQAEFQIGYRFIDYLGPTGITSDSLVVVTNKNPLNSILRGFFDFQLKKSRKEKIQNEVNFFSKVGSFQTLEELEEFYEKAEDRLLAETKEIIEMNKELQAVLKKTHDKKTNSQSSGVLRLKTSPQIDFAHITVLKDEVNNQFSKIIDDYDFLVELKLKIFKEKHLNVVVRELTLTRNEKFLKRANLKELNMLLNEHLDEVSSEFARLNKMGEMYLENTTQNSPFYLRLSTALEKIDHIDVQMQELLLSVR